MTNILPEETLIAGEWLALDGRVVASENCARIYDLVEHVLRHLAKDASGWDQLYIDPTDGRLWERVYLQSELHGGGPPTLRYIDNLTAKQKYNYPR